jgi:hypothetical protein
MRRWGFVVVAVLLLQVAASEAEAAAIYDYTGRDFTVCGFGCPGNGPELDAAPPNWDEDYLIASLTFIAPLASNLTFDDDVRAALVEYSVSDHLGHFSQTGTELPDVEEDGEFIPGLKLATDANGNITAWIMAVDGLTQTFSANPPVICPASECGEDFGIADFVAVNIGLPGDDGEWDAGNGTPGAWGMRAQVPEPATLALSLIALGGFAVRQRRQSFARK